MGTRDNYETVTRVMQAFVAQRTWQQAELARHVEVQPRALRSLGTTSPGSSSISNLTGGPRKPGQVDASVFATGIIDAIQKWPTITLKNVKIDKISEF